jgi:tetratricopeptide (TPR) repeat protein
VAPDWDFTHNLFATLAGYRRLWRECEEHCRRALELNPESKTALHNLGNSLRQTGRKREASECYHRVLVLDPSDMEARRALLTLVNWDMAELPIWKRKQRLEEEHPTVQAFVKDAQERTNREASAVIAAIWLGMGWLFTLGWTLLVLAFTSQGGLLHRWWEWAAYLAVVTATLLGTVYMIRKRRNEAR